MFFKKSEQQLENEKTISLIGKVLIVVGFIDIAFMIWAISQKMNYSSSLNIFAVIAGIFLVNGSFKMAKIVSFFAGMFLGAGVIATFIIPVITPVSYWIVYAKLNTFSFLLNSLITVGLFVLIAWIYIKLTSASMIEDMKKKGVKFDKLRKKKHTGLVVGVVFGLIIFSFSFFMFRGNTTDMVIEKARQEYGNDYSYIIQGMNMSTANGQTSGSANVAAYNDKEIKNILIKF